MIRRGLFGNGAAVYGSRAWTPLYDTNWRQPLTAGYDSLGVIGTGIANSSTNKTLPQATMAASPTTAIAPTSAAVTSGSPTVTVIKVAHGLSTGNTVRVTGTTTTPANQANGLWKITVTGPDAYTYVPSPTTNFTVNNAAIGGVHLLCTGTVRDLSFKFGTIPTDLSFLYLIFGDAAVAVEYCESLNSVDGSATSGTWTTTTITPYGAPLVSGSGWNSGVIFRGDALKVSASNIVWGRIRLTYYNDTSVMDAFVGAFLCPNGTTVKGDLWLNPGTSLVQQDNDVRVLRLRLQNQDATRDPIIINAGYQGATVQLIYTAMVQQWATRNVPPTITYLQPGPNDVGQGRPYATDPNPTQVAVSMQNIATYVASTWPFSTFFSANIGHVNFVSPNVNDLANTSNGVEPYNAAQVEPKIQASFGAFNWDGTNQTPVINEQAAFSEVTPVPLFTDGTHLVGPYYNLTQQGVNKIASYTKTGVIPVSTIDDAIASIEAHGAPSAIQSRWVTVLSLVSGTHTALSARLAAVPTTYQQPTSLDFSADSLDWWVAPEDFGTVTQSAFQISQITDKTANAFALIQGTTSRQPFVIPPLVQNNNGLFVMAGNSAAQISMPAGMYGTLNAALQPFMIFFTISCAGVGSSGAIMQFAQGAANKLLISVSNVASQLGLPASSQVRVTAATAALPNGTSLLAEPSTSFVPVYTPAHYAVLYDGVTISLWKNNVQIGTAAWVKPAWTADGGALLSNAAYTSRFNGYAGTNLGRLTYNLPQAQSIMTRLMAGWGY